jgi:hypothetical protein
MKTHRAVLRLSAIAGLALCGCATTPKTATEAIRNANNAVINAEDARAADYASAEMHSAHEKLNAARALAAQITPDPNDPNRTKARWLAEEAAADAELADAKARKVRTQSVVRSLQPTPSTPIMPPPADLPVAPPPSVDQPVPDAPAPAAPEPAPAPAPAAPAPDAPAPDAPAAAPPATGV